MKVFITGMTAAQGSSSNNKRKFSFAGHMVKALESAGHTVTWAYPEMDYKDDFFASYDAILVGVAPPLSTSSNRAYGALKLLQALFYDPRLRLFIDAPVPAQITGNLTSIQTNPDGLFKKFFSSRHGYDQAIGRDRDRILLAVDLLAEQDWPTTIWPKLPFTDARPDWLSWMPLGLQDSLVPLNLDSWRPIFPPYVRTPGDDERDQIWLSETLQSSWLNSTLRGLIYNAAPMKEWKAADDGYVMYCMAHSWGSLVPPQKDGNVWWTTRFLQSLDVGTPVITEWRQSQFLGPSWAILGSQIEDMDAGQLEILAEEQKKAYLARIPDKANSLAALEKALQ